MTKPNSTRRVRPVLIVGLTTIGVLLLLREPIQRQVMLSTALREPSVTPEPVDELASASTAICTFESWPWAFLSR